MLKKRGFKCFAGIFNEIFIYLFYFIIFEALHRTSSDTYCINTCQYQMEREKRGRVEDRMARGEKRGGGSRELEMMLLNRIHYFSLPPALISSSLLGTLVFGRLPLLGAVRGESVYGKLENDGLVLRAHACRK